MMCPMYPAATTKATNATNRISAEVAERSLGRGSSATSILLRIARLEPFLMRRRTLTYVARPKLTSYGECREAADT